MSATNSQQLKYISDLTEKCHKCPLYKTAHHAVPGAGNPEAKIMLIGEAPGFHEDEAGLPFVGNSGKLLDKLLQAIELNRDEVFIGNVVKHRPPDNRDPLPQEIVACVPYLKAQLKIIRPKIVITLGRFAMNYFFPIESISKIHGQFRSITWQGIPLVIIPVYHPSAGLRNGAMLQALQLDFIKIQKYLKNNYATN